MDEIDLSPRLLCALKELMRAELEDRQTRDAQCAGYTWGKCKVTQFKDFRGFNFEYGVEECKPPDFPEGSDVWVSTV